MANASATCAHDAASHVTIAGINTSCVVNWPPFGVQSHFGGGGTFTLNTSGSVMYPPPTAASARYRKSECSASSRREGVSPRGRLRYFCFKAAYRGWIRAWRSSKTTGFQPAFFHDALQASTCSASFTSRPLP